MKGRPFWVSQLRHTCSRVVWRFRPQSKSVDDMAHSNVDTIRNNRSLFGVNELLFTKMGVQLFRHNTCFASSVLSFEHTFVYISKYRVICQNIQTFGYPYYFGGFCIFLAIFVIFQSGIEWATTLVKESQTDKQTVLIVESHIGSE